MSAKPVQRLNRSLAGCRSIGKIIEEGLLLRRIKPAESARQLGARARLQAGLTEDGATRMDVEEIHAQRNA
ncbi:MAG: hypothetical protein NTW45_13660 [Rhodocyclales bacterium]|nr:hypothetical protein [Rhodocyclales bacterium]